MMADGRELTPRRQRFVDLLLADPRLTPTEAARRAGYSAATADRQAHRLMQDPRIRSAIDARRRELQEETHVTQRRVIEELARIAFADIGAYYETDPDTGEVRVRPLDAMTPEERAALSDVSITSTGAVRVRLADKQRALEMLSKHLGLFREQIDVTVSGGVVVLPEWRQEGDADA